jgi:hypothetical protein
MRQYLRSEMRMPSLPDDIFTDIRTIYFTSFNIRVLYMSLFNMRVLYTKPFNILFVCLRSFNIPVSYFRSLNTLVLCLWSFNMCFCLRSFNPLKAELNPICHLLALLGGATIVVVSRIRVNKHFLYLRSFNVHVLYLRSFNMRFRFKVL